MIEARTQLAAKIEGTEGQAEALTKTEAFLAANFKFTPDTPAGERPNVSASLSPWAPIPGARSAKMEFDVELKGSGTKGTAPALGALLKACGFGETVSANTSVTYKPASTSISSITIASYEDGIMKKIWGARGNVSLKLEDGAPGWLHFEFTGADFSVTDVTMLADVTYESTKPIAFLAATLTIDSYSALIGALEINMNNAVALRKDINSASGYKSAVITNRKPSMTIDPEAVLVATYDFYGKLRSGNEGALSLALTGSAGNVCTITAPKVQYTAISDDVKEGLRNLGITCQLNRNAGDDELSIVFT
ncbi:MAG TPA: hypothetical protein DDW17_02165 [Deltaproteobacteria bacterium]|nr:hypothetical protein [Deltaproteobacteria bacterium]